MVKKAAFSLLLIVSYFTLTGQTINSTNSKVTFKISNMGLNTVNGSFTGMQGDISFSLNDLANAKFEVCVEAGTINTGIEKRDKHLKNEDYFDVEKFPNICFTSNEIVKTSSGFSTTGTLNMHGQTKTIDIPFIFEGKIFKGSFTVKRLDYGIGPKGGFMVGKEVEIEIVCEVN